MKFGIIGTGIVGTTLGIKLVEAGYKCVGVNTRSTRSFEQFSAYLNIDHLQYYDFIPEVDLLFITTQDDLIKEVAQSLIDQGLYREGQTWIHCSGALGADVLKCGSRDLPFKCLSLHPLQAFANVETALNLIKGTHFGIEGDEPRLGERIVRDLGGIPHNVKGELKGLYHAGAVTASNYLVTLASLAVELLHTAGIEKKEALQSLLPLMEGTLENLAQAGLPDALTGPIARGDIQIIKQHLDDMPLQLREPYDILGSHTLGLAAAKWERKNLEYPETTRQELLKLFKHKHN